MQDSPTINETIENLRQELRRGSLALAVLGELRQELYGYTLRKSLAEHGLAVQESSLYPLLHRQEIQGLLVSEWREESNRKRRYYRLSEGGAKALPLLLEEWHSINECLNRLFMEPIHESN